MNVEFTSVDLNVFILHAMGESEGAHRLLQGIEEIPRALTGHMGAGMIGTSDTHTV